jgi:hypothetical protein
MLTKGSLFLDEEQLSKLRSLVEKYRDIWRVGLIDVGPAKCKSFKVHLKSDAVPRQPRVRDYAPKHRDWMLEKKGFIRRNPSSRWSSPVVTVPRQEVLTSSG